MEPMNTVQNHSKLRVSVALSAPLFVAGEDITGKMEMECKTDKGLGISVMMVDLIATQGPFKLRCTIKDCHIDWTP